MRRPAQQALTRAPVCQVLGGTLSCLRQALMRVAKRCERARGLAPLALSWVPPDWCLICWRTCDVESTWRRGWLTRAPLSRVCHLVRRGVLSQLQACGTSACVFDEKEEATVASQFRQSCCAILRLGNCARERNAQSGCQTHLEFNVEA